MRKPKDADTYDWENFTAWLDANESKGVKQAELSLDGKEFVPVSTLFWDCWKAAYSAAVDG